MLRGAAIIKSLILSTAIFIFFTCCIPFHLSADTNTYYVFESGEQVLVSVNNNDINNVNNNCFKIVSSYETRTVFFDAYYNLNSGRHEYCFMVFSKYPFTCYSGSIYQFNNNNPTNNTIYNKEYNGETIYYLFKNPNSYSSSISFPYNPIDLKGVVAAGSNVQNNIFPVVVEYAYGSAAVDPSPIINHGDLIDLGYYTNFTNSQQSNYLQMRNNKDTISWNGYEDSNGNQINTIDYQVEIQAYATEYEAQTKQGLLGLTLTDLQNYGTPVTIYEGSANRGEFSVFWGDVADALNGTSTTIDFWSQMAPHSYENMWYSHGWLYRIRLKTSDDSYIGDWQTIYTMASAPPADAETVYNYYYYYGGQGITDDVVDVLNNINTTNNTQNIWYINNNPVDPSGGSSDWLEILLKFISDMIGKIIDLFSNMFDTVLDFLLGLFDNIDPVGTFKDWWTRLKNLFNSIDLTLPSFNLPDNNDLSSFSILVQKTLEIFTLNGLGFIIFIPLIIMIVRLFL